MHCTNFEIIIVVSLRHFTILFENVIQTVQKIQGKKTTMAGYNKSFLQNKRLNNILKCFIIILLNLDINGNELLQCIGGDKPIS